MRFKERFKEQEFMQEIVFKDAVLSAAESRRMEIIGQAQHEAAAELAQVQQSCALIDETTINAKYQRDSEREHSSLTLAARAQLMARRAQLVSDIFTQVEQRLAAFTGQEGYRSWLLGRLAAYTVFGEKGSLTVSLRAQDLPLEADIQKALPGSTVAQDNTIRLGGAKISNGRLLYDETLDSRLEAERQRFYETSGLNLP